MLIVASSIGAASARLRYNHDTGLYQRVNDYDTGSIDVYRTNVNTGAGSYGKLIGDDSSGYSGSLYDYKRDTYTQINVSPNAYVNEFEY